jgi:periplasmic protein TonB
MASNDPAINNHTGGVPGKEGQPEYHLTLLDTPLPIVSLVRQVREQWREPKVSVSADYCSDEIYLPLSDMRPWYRDLPAQIGSLFETNKPPAISLSSRPIEVPEIWQDFQPHPASWGNALVAHVLAVTAIILPFALKNMLEPVEMPKRVIVYVDYFGDLHLPPSPTTIAGAQPHGGGGGGDRTPLPPSRGAIPRFARVQFAPPQVKVPNVAPLMAVQPTLLGMPELKLPEMVPNVQWGDPRGVMGRDSSGPGSRGGIGTGDDGGVGPGEGPGYGPGKGGNTGGERFAYGVGNGVTAPVPIFKPEPAYSEEARKAKYQGNVTLWIVVSPQGTVTDVRVAKPLGMGLDEKAVEAVRTWRFKPGARNGIAVAVRVLVEVSFRLF